LEKKNIRETVKKELSIDTTFDPSYFSTDFTFKRKKNQTKNNTIQNNCLACQLQQNKIMIMHVADRVICGAVVTLLMVTNCWLTSGHGERTPLPHLHWWG
jgi:hypothetical protein